MRVSGSGAGPCLPQPCDPPESRPATLCAQRLGSLGTGVSRYVILNRNDHRQPCGLVHLDRHRALPCRRPRASPYQATECLALQATGLTLAWLVNARPGTWRRERDGGPMMIQDETHTESVPKKSGQPKMRPAKNAARKRPVGVRARQTGSLHRGRLGGSEKKYDRTLDETDLLRQDELPTSRGEHTWSRTACRSSSKTVSSTTSKPS